MKTREELQEMPQEELMNLVEKLQKENKDASESRSYWMNEHNKIKSKYDNFRNLVKSVVLIID